MSLEQQARIDRAYLYLNKETGIRSIAIVVDTEGERETLWYALTSTLCKDGRWAGKSTETRSREMIANAVPAASAPGGKIILSALVGAEIRLLRSEEDGSVSALLPPVIDVV